MAHTHSHEHDSDTYYLDQLCLIALSGAFAGLCLTMYFWQPRMLGLMLAPTFHKFVLWSGFALLGLVLVRSVTLWRAVGRQQQHAHGHAGGHEHGHEHAHGHHHHHAHAHHVHEAGPGRAAVAEAPSPALPHEHEHCHEHDHEHGCCGHEHGWAPWKYVVLLLPIMLYLLGLPSQPPSAMGGALADLNQEVPLYAGLVGCGTSPLGSLPLAAAAAGDRVDPTSAKQVGLKELESASYDPESREHWQGQVVRVVGQYAPDPRTDRALQLVRYRIQCCAADAIRVSIPGLCRESLPPIRPNAWVEVTGRVAFLETAPGMFITFLQVPRRNNVRETTPDPNPYIQ